MNRDEHWLSKQLKKKLKTIDGIFVQQYIATPQTGRGNPDFLIVVNGFPLFVELKHPTDLSSVPRPDQLIVHQQIRNAGGYVLVSRSVKRAVEAVELIRDWGTSTLTSRWGEDGMKDLD